ncbi:hypothetical protein MASR1M59_28900 [Melaminivora sp.]
MTSQSTKQMAITVIDEAMRAGARQHKACAQLGVSSRTLRRWRSRQADARKGAVKQCPQALSEDERQRIIAVCNTPEHQSLPPSQIVPRLADAGVYIASESSFYRVLRAHGQAQRRGRARTPRKVSRPQALRATAPNQVWSWDITYLPSTVRGQFLRLYLVLDVYSRAIVGWEVHESESASHAATLITKACLRHQVSRQQRVLHSDNGSPMKGATLQRLGVMPSFSRPSVSDDNPYSEALIRFVTPAQRHARCDADLLARRTDLYRAAKRAMPERWQGRAVRNWTPVTEVWLNPDKPQGQDNEIWPLVA